MFHIGGPEHVVGVVPLPVRVAVVVDHLVAVPLELVPQELVGRGIGLYRSWARDSGLASRQGQDATTTTRQRNRASGTRQNLKFF